jgi:uncharacterized zinc-type alcohol dehydrogenase-like protein
MNPTPLPTFNAYAATNPQAALQPFTFDPGELGPEEVEIKVTHCGICHSDLLQFQPRRLEWLK